MELQAGCKPATPTRPLAVLDTNVVLALYRFQDARLRPLASALEAAQLEWVSTRPMRQELAHVLAQGRLPVGQAGAPEPLLACDRLTRRVLAPQGSRFWPRCTDEDDQKFVDLAIGEGAAWLLTRDRAVLKLRHKVRTLSGGQVLRPEDWSP